jgi:hypothetical protein
MKKRKNSSAHPTRHLMVPISHVPGPPSQYQKNFPTGRFLHLLHARKMPDAKLENVNRGEKTEKKMESQKKCQKLRFPGLGKKKAIFCRQ